ncbi:hypothetical protein [Pseudomonas frederiksbergensis]|uniref:Uncharacterized protein n=1 Tax=Pseudomonas frederiksbergensis TaxID=104087 RepID=A0A423I237_9PSED|nr:hypothetical protein [Pseudomonas frederiksbergensis]RON19498.1 hypothetical protein BK662_02680 [Pseudomonas frederiksbergensis]
MRVNDKRLIDFGIPARGDRPVDVDRDKRFGSADPDDDYTRSEVFSFTAGVDYRINDHPRSTTNSGAEHPLPVLSGT